MAVSDAEVTALINEVAYFCLPIVAVCGTLLVVVFTGWIVTDPLLRRYKCWKLQREYERAVEVVRTKYDR